MLSARLKWGGARRERDTECSASEYVMLLYTFLQNGTIELVDSYVVHYSIAGYS